MFGYPLLRLLHYEFFTTKIFSYLNFSQPYLNAYIYQSFFSNLYIIIARSLTSSVAGGGANEGRSEAHQHTFYSYLKRVFKQKFRPNYA